MNFDYDSLTLQIAEVVEIYEYSKQDAIGKFVGLRPEIVRIGSDFSTNREIRLPPQLRIS